MKMKDLAKDKELISLAEYYGIDIFSLSMDDTTEYESTAIQKAHKIRGDSRFQIMNFLSEAIRPKAVSPEFIFKALKFNDEFYIQNIPLIRATEWMRQDTYNQNNDNLEKNKKLITPFPKIIKTNGKLAAKTKPKHEENSTVITEAIAASNNDNQIILQACYQNNTMLEFKVVDAMVYLNDSNDRIVILLDINNEDFTSMDRKKYYIELFKNRVERYKTNVIPKRNGELIEFSAFIPKGIIELGIQWGISEEGNK